ncbi:hypothetical protein HOF65_00275 [bacterium]|nr:hypothetical protein [bacterium]MBT3852485.1 hypothetical protein [bacterium]MBT4632649.1 hypothetical protein [bacterium]MBT6778331.1 hypothetical protein [bacterium]
MAVNELSTTFALATELFANSLAHILSAAISAAYKLLSCISDPSTVHCLILSHSIQASAQITVEESTITAQLVHIFVPIADVPFQFCAHTI